MSKYSMVRLEELAADQKSAISKPYGSAILKSDYRMSGVPVVRGVNLARGIFHDDDFVFIDSTVADRMPGAELNAGDLVVTHRGTIGQVSMIPRTPRYERYVASTSHVKVRLDPKRAVPEYYYYWFASHQGRQTILQYASAVGVPGISQPVASIKSLMVPYPSMTIQQAIAEVLGALDVKIAANGKLIAAADTLSRTTFSGMLNESELRPLTEVARFVNGKAFTKGASGTGRVVIRIAELNSGIGGSTVYNDLNVADDYLARSGDLLFAWSGSLTLHRWFRPEGIINQHIFKVIPQDHYPLWLVNQVLICKLDYFKAVAADKATTMGHIQRRHLEEVVAVPPRSVIARYDDAMTALWNTALNAERESLRLGEIRDVLLPHLMSGRLRVKDAEKRVEAVV